MTDPTIGHLSKMSPMYYDHVVMCTSLKLKNSDVWWFWVFPVMCGGFGFSKSCCN